MMIKLKNNRSNVLYGIHYRREYRLSRIFVQYIIFIIFSLTMEYDYGSTILFMGSRYKQLLKNKKNIEINEIKIRNYYTGYLPGKDRIELKKQVKELGLTDKQIDHPLIFDLNEKTKELNITNITHGSYLFERRLEKVGIDTINNKKIVYIKEFNNSIVISKGDKGEKILKALEEVLTNIKEKNPVINMNEFINKLEKQAKNDKIEINLNIESKIEFIVKIQEMIKNIKD